MEADHAHVTPAAERLRQTAARYRSDAGDQPRADFRDAVSGLSQALLPHLRGEEDEAMPLVAAVLTEAEWRHWDQANNVKGKSLGRLAADGHWLMDGLDPARYTTLIHLVPAPVRIVIIKGYARRYRAECARRWGPSIPVGPAAAAPPTDGGPHPRSAEQAARCTRILLELELLSGSVDGSARSLRAVSSEGTELERSAAFRAYRARHEEGKQYLERQRQT